MIPVQRAAPDEVWFLASERRELPHSHRSPAVGRQVVRDVLADRPDELVETVEILTSELVTNAVLHARSTLTLHVQATARSIRVTVEDATFRVPEPRDAADLAEGGRGLLLVGALASSWGWNRTSTGKAVWFEVSLPG
jgi:anti-sigma regulatory factor (Ser/Thr protein kinase)